MEEGRKPPTPGIGPVPPGGTRSLRSRVVVCLKMCHQLPEFDADGPPPVAYTEQFETTEQPYRRKIKVGEAWRPIDFGWTNETGCSFLHMVNETPPRGQTVPTPEERDAAAMKVLEIGKVIKGLGGPNGEYVEPVGVLYVGQPLVLSPLDQDRFRVRCRSGETYYSVYCTPADPE